MGCRAVGWIVDPDAVCRGIKYGGRCRRHKKGTEAPILESTYGAVIAGQEKFHGSRFAMVQRS